MDNAYDLQSGTLTGYVIEGAPLEALLLRCELSQRRRSAHLNAFGRIGGEQEV